MTHLSDFSYLQRIAQEIYLAAFLLIRMWQSKGFNCLSPRRLINGELRSIITWFMFLLLIAQASWDILCTYIKYTEGFMQVAPGVIISKPFEYWKPGNQNPIEVMNYIQCVTFSLQVSILLLLQCFWNYLSNSVAKHSFMGSKEFTFYIIWTLGSIAIFPVLNYFYKHTILEEVVPQTAYSCEILLVALLGFRNHRRFNRLIKAATENGKSTDTHVRDRLTYFRDMNLLLSLALVAFGGSIFILCMDGFTANKLINTNKFAADFLICNTNISSIFLWLIIIGIFHPARVGTDSKRKGTGRTTSQDNTHGTAPQTHHRDNDVSKTGTSPPTRYVYGNNKTSKQGYVDMDSTKVLTKETDSELELGYMSSSPSESIHNMPTAMNGTVGGLSHPRHNYNQRSNVVSIDDPFGNESISFSMINSATKYNNNNNSDNSAMVYASAVDHHHAPNPYHLSSSTSPSSPSPPFSSPLPPPPPSSSSSNQLQYLDLRPAASSPPPNQDLPPIPTTAPATTRAMPENSTPTATAADNIELPWLDRSTSPGRR